jgi:hypothetical protein
MRNNLIARHGKMEREEKPQMTLFALFVDCTIGALLWVLLIYVIAGWIG